MRNILSFYSLLFTIGFLMTSCSDDEETKPKNSISLEEEIMTLVNEHRTNNGLMVLEHSSACAREATDHSENMANGKVDFGHDGFNDRFDVIALETGASGAGENVARGFEAAIDVMTNWLNSPGHRANIEGDYTHLGIGIAESSDGEQYFTQIFAKIE